MELQYRCIIVACRVRRLISHMISVGNSTRASEDSKQAFERFAKARYIAFHRNIYSPTLDLLAKGKRTAPSLLQRTPQLNNTAEIHG